MSTLFDLFADPYAEARAFYGPHTFEALLQKQLRREECIRLASDLVPMLIDEVAHQTPRLSDIWPTTNALIKAHYGIKGAKP